MLWTVASKLKKQQIWLPKNIKIQILPVTKFPSQLDPRFLEFIFQLQIFPYLQSTRSLFYVISNRTTRCQWRIQDFPQGGRQLPKWVCQPIFLAENCMKMKEFGPPGGRASLAPPLDQPLDAISNFLWFHKFWKRIFPLTHFCGYCVNQIH